MAATKSFAASILRQCGFESEHRLYQHINRLPETAFSRNGLPSKKAYSAYFQNTIGLIEYEGEVVRETKEMTDPGNLVDFMRTDYLSIRSAYFKKRKQLKEQLEKIRTLS